MTSLPLTANVSVDQVAAFLTANGVKVERIARAEDETVDDDIIINNSVHVQVGQGYAGVVTKQGRGMLFLAMRYDAKDLLTDLADAIKHT